MLRTGSESRLIRVPGALTFFTESFEISSTTLITFFIISFRALKAVENLISGALSDQWGRRPVLLLGWLLGLPVPFLIIHAHSWTWILMANMLLGLNQGLAWSMTVNMILDLVGPAKNVCLGLGLRECAG